jgi:hypothetical protein
MHHSTSDWDFYSGFWTLDTIDYISLPSSMRIFYASVDTGEGITLKDAAALDILEGQIDAYIKVQRALDWICLGFRIDAAPGSHNWIYGTNPPDGCYWHEGYALQFCLSSGVVYLKRAHFAYYTYAMTHKPANLTAWNIYRVSYWSDTGGAGLMCRLEYWDGASWIAMLSDMNDPTDYNKIGATYRRIGVGGYISANNALHYDDIEVYKAT